MEEEGGRVGGPRRNDPREDRGEERRSEFAVLVFRVFECATRKYLERREKPEEESEGGTRESRESRFRIYLFF